MRYGQAVACVVSLIVPPRSFLKNDACQSESLKEIRRRTEREDKEVRQAVEVGRGQRRSKQVDA